ncbi:hypothetical protein AMECASPLE_028004 [Ameca splendens]|uniref:Uncharacterized protein n=1 Tax=Ameca splendens TaxID=208324 RepID=A0ABV0YGJ1_9TELE
MDGEQHLNYTNKFFTSSDSAKGGKDALAKQLEKDLRTSTEDGASKALEPPEKAPSGVSSNAKWKQM